MKKKFNRTHRALEAVFSFLDTFADQNQLDAEYRYYIHLAVEEIFSNIVKYSTGSTQKIELEILRDASRIVIHVVDQNIQPFDPTRVPEYDIRQNLQDRPLGKLGIHLIKKLTDEIYCDYSNGKNRVTLIKKMEGTYV